MIPEIRNGEDVPSAAESLYNGCLMREVGFDYFGAQAFELDRDGFACIAGDGADVVEV